MALKMMEEYGDDLTVIYVESQGYKHDEMEQFVLKKKGWLTDRGIWTVEAPLQTGATGLPNAALIGNDGKLLWKGSPTSDHSKIEAMIAEQLKLAKKGPKDLPLALQKPWTDFEKGDYAVAINALDAVQDGPDKDAARKLSASFNVRVRAKVAKLEWLIENARFEAADKLAATLQKGLAAHATLEPKVTELAKGLTSKEMTAEREAAKALDKIEKRIAKDGMEPAVVKLLTAFGEKFPNTRAAKRAAHFAQVVAGTG